MRYFHSAVIALIDVVDKDVLNFKVRVRVRVRVRVPSLDDWCLHGGWWPLVGDENELME